MAEQNPFDELDDQLERLNELLDAPEDAGTPEDFLAKLKDCGSAINEVLSNLTMADFEAAYATVEGGDNDESEDSDEG